MNRAQYPTSRKRKGKALTTEVKAKFNKSQAAKALGVTRAQLYVMQRQYGLG